ncbi:MAG: hypothetical protein A3E01_05585 [Gammaproteobacteria bacterium RIFCSPHIGHO2_12_FULL_63_22]|nr:MAG: hypothetical protein A3E01_05585 [Gammaproteobacteria bacterium RIFCSPHIGHO2_12_FULL_63_22]
MPGSVQAIKRQFAELRRRRVFRTMGAYLVVAWLALQVADATFEPLGLPLWSQRALIIAVIVGFIPAAILAWAFDITRRGLVRTEPATLARRASDGPGGSRLATPVIAGPMSAIASIAVLPFTDLSQARDQDWFCDGLAEEIIDSMCCVRGLRVASRTASFRFRDGSVDPREIGRQLNVDVVLEGSVRKAGDQLRVTAQLVDASSGFHQWSETFNRKVEDVFAIQSEIAQHVAEALKMTLTGPGLGRAVRYAPQNLDAYEFYLRGRQLLGQVNEAAWRQAPRMFRRAIELDPNYAQALAGLADSLAQQILWRFEPAAAVLPEATAAAAKALDLAPDLAEAHVAQGHVRSLSGDGEGARRAFERALELNPGLFEAFYYYARQCYAHGDYARAAELFQQAFRIRPDDFSVLALAVAAVDSTGDSAAADAIARRALDGLLRQIELEPDNIRALYMSAGLMQRLGQGEEGLAQADKALRLRPDDFSTLYNVACVYSIAGKVERALDLLEKAIQNGGGNLGWIVNDSDLASLRSSPRFQTLIASLRDRPAAEASD